MDIALIAIVVTLAVGLIFKYGFDRTQGSMRQRFYSRPSISWAEYSVGSVIIMMILVPATITIGNRFARQNQIHGFEQYLNGYETDAVWTRITCSKDGPCIHEYDCDPYQCNPHDCFCTCTSRDEHGNCTSESCQTCWDTCYHDCPYTTEEWTFEVHTTVGNVTIASHVFPEDPHQHRWQPHRRERLPQSLIDRVGAGVPDFWQVARDRLDNDAPGPATFRGSYINYILASQSSILRTYHSQEESYRELGLIPNLATSTFDFYYANRFYPVGYDPGDRAAEWFEETMRFNAAFGMELQGDLHLVIVDDDLVGTPDDYVGAIMTNWLSSDREKEALGKNSLVVVLGTENGETVAWARAETGMPVGNEGLEIDIRNMLPGTSLTPEAVLGRIRYNRRGEAQHTDGALERAVWGDPGFVRRCMECLDPGETGGFGFLYSDIKPTGKQRVFITIIAIVLGILLWVGAVFLEDQVLNRVFAPISSFAREWWRRHRTHFIKDAPGAHEREEDNEDRW